MGHITKEADGSCKWDCPIEKDYHRRSGWGAILGISAVCIFVFLIFLFTSSGTDAQKDLWIPLLVIGVILLIALPLIFLWNSAEDPHEQYVMSEDYVKSGYGKSAIFSEFKKTGEVTITPKYIELTGKFRNNRIYVPSEDMDFVRDFILDRIPDDAAVRHL